MTVTLSTPLHKKNGFLLPPTIIEEISLRPPKLKDLKELCIIPESPKFNESMKILISRLSGVPAETLENLDIRDYFKLVKIVADSMI